MRLLARAAFAEESAKSGNLPVTAAASRQPQPPIRQDTWTPVSRDSVKAALLLLLGDLPAPDERQLDAVVQPLPSPYKALAIVVELCHGRTLHDAMRQKAFAERIAGR